MPRFLAVYLIFGLSLPLLAADPFQLSAERIAAVSPWPVDNVAVALDGELCLLVWNIPGTTYAMRLDGNGAPLDPAPLLLPSWTAEPKVIFDGDEFVIVGRHVARGLEAIWVERDGTVRGPTRFASDAVDFSLTTLGLDAVVVVTMARTLTSAEPLAVFRLTRDHSAILIREVDTTSEHLADAAANAHRAAIVWAESTQSCFVHSMAEWCYVYPFLRYTTFDLDSGSMTIHPRWKDRLRDKPGIVSIGEDLVALWIEPQGSYYFWDGSPSTSRIAASNCSMCPLSAVVIGIDGEPTENPERVTPVWKWIDYPSPLQQQPARPYAVASTGSRALVTHVFQDPRNMQGRWLEIEGDAVRASSSFDIAQGLRDFAIAGSDSGRVAIVYTKVSESVPRTIYIRFAGQREPSRGRPVRR